MKLRIPDYACLYHDGKPAVQKPNPWGSYQEGEKIEFYNDELKAELSSSSGKIWFELSNDELDVYATTYENGAKYVQLRWNFTARKDVKVLGDAYERGYGNLQWSTIYPERCMPWYMAVSNGSDSVLDYSGRLTECFGVKVCPNALCFWQYDIFNCN